MNVFAIVILSALLLEFVLGLAADLLNIRASRREPPPSLQDIYKEDDYLRSQRYLRAHTRLSLISRAFFLVLLLALWFSGGFNWLDQAVREWGLYPLLTGLVYLGIIFGAYSILGLPFSIYGTFVIEERFGFNRTTGLTFFMDRVKGVLLAMVLGGLLLAGVIALFQFAGDLAWLYCWAVVVAFSLVLSYVAPTWIMPLFNRFTPMPDGELREAILEYAATARFPVKNVFVMDGSKRSTRSNAFFTGFGRNKRIALFDTLIAQHTVPEMVAILAHEIGHYKKKHVIQGTVISILHAGVLLFLLSLFLGSAGLYEAFYMQQPSVYAGLLFFGLLYTPIEMVLSTVLQWLSRKHEYEADRFAAETLDHPGSMVSALKKLHALNLSNLTPHPLYVFLNYSHPPLFQRLQAIEKAVKSGQPHS